MIQKLRIASLIGVHVLILAHIYIFGDKVIGSLDFQEFFHSIIKYGIINSGVLLVLLAFFTTLIFGRFFCGWACHFGAIQEFSWWILNKINIKPKTINSSLVTILPLFILINFYIAPNLIYAFSKPWQGIIVKLENPDCRRLGRWRGIDKMKTHKTQKRKQTHQAPLLPYIANHGSLF